MWVALGIAIRDARLSRRWSVRALAERADVSPAVAYRVEAGRSASTEAATRLANALGLRLEFQLTDPRRRADSRTALSADPVHSAMGEFEVGHLRAMGFPIGVDEPYQHYQFAGRADVVAWDLTQAALLHIENRTRFPDFQEMAGAYNAKRAYLAEAIGERVGVRRWSSQTHVVVALWSAEVLHALRMRTESFRSLCPDGPEAFAGWWSGVAPTVGTTSAMILLDPLAAGRERQFIGFPAGGTTRPRYRGYADALAADARAA
jgi:hypothetical protein